jgi:uncharacterized protein
MTGLILDSLGRYRETPAFLAMAGPPDRAWPRILAGLVLGGLAGAIAAGVVAFLVLQVGAWRLHPDLPQAAAIDYLMRSDRPGRDLASYRFEFAMAGLASFAFAAGFLLVAAQVFRRPIRSFLTAAPRFRWGQVGLGLAFGLVMVGLGVMLERIWLPAAEAGPIFRASEAQAARLAYIAAALAMLYLAALAEEALFRGWLLQQVGAWTRSVPVILAVNGLLFSFLHFDPNLGGFVVRCIMGAGWAWIALRLGGVEFTTGAHLANNFIVSLFVAPPSFVTPAPEAFDPRAVAVELAIVLALVAVVELVLRRTRPATP